MTLCSYIKENPWRIRQKDRRIYRHAGLITLCSYVKKIRVNPRDTWRLKNQQDYTRLYRYHAEQKTV